MSYFKRDQLSIKTNKMLGNLLAQLILLSQKVQSFRQILSSVPYYDCVQLFRVLDKGEKGYLTLDDFVQLIGQSHKKIVTYAFAWFDQGKLGEVSRLQFISFLMPRRSPQLRQTTARRIEQPVNDNNYSVTINQQLRIFTQLLNQMISHELKIIEQRRSLLKQQDYSIKGVLHSLDINAHQFVSVNDIVKFLKNYAIQATKEQINDFLEIVDSKLTGKITLEQLTWIVQGLENNNKAYLSKIKTSMKKKDSRRKYSKTRNQQTKHFVRTPQKSTQQKSIDHSRSYNTNQVNSHQASRLKNSNYNSRQVYQIQQSRNNRTSQNNQQNIDEKLPSYANTNFDTILERYRQAQNQALRRDADLIKAELQIKNKLQDQFQLKSNSRRRVLTEVNTMASQSRRKEQVPKYEQKDFINNDFRYSRALRNDINNDYRSSTAIKPQTRLYEPFTLNHIYPYVSQYDKKINTIVQNFYRRNTDSSSDVSRKYGTISNSFDQKRQRSISTSNNRSLYDKQQSSHNKFLEDDLYADRTRVKAFDHGSGLLKEEINKKLGDDIFNIKLSNRRYDPLAHQAKQRPLQESIKRLKESSQRIEPRIQKINQASPKMMENISIISRDTPKIQVSAAKPYPERESNIYSTDIKVNKTSTPSSGYQTVARGQTTKNRDLHTTETRYPTRQTESKIAQSPLMYQRRQL